MKVFIDRISDLLDLPDLLDQGRRFRGKTAYIVCTSIYDEASATFLSALQETFSYLGMRYGGCAHADCNDGYTASRYEDEIAKFVSRLNTN